MQVFLPELSFEECAAVLDTKRLVKQLLEGRQILQALMGETAGWVNHPATKMFKGHEGVLYNYLKANRDEMENRGYKWQNNWSEITRIKDTYLDDAAFSNPSWMDDNRFSRLVITHRGRLHQKAPELYPQYESESKDFMELVCCPGKCTYFWVTHNAKA